MISLRRTTLAVFVGVGAALAAPAAFVGLSSAAFAATSTDATKAFCAQLQTSQTAMAAIPAASKDRLAKIAGEWSKIGRFAPSKIKADTDSIAAA